MDGTDTGSRLKDYSGSGNYGLVIGSLTTFGPGILEKAYGFVEDGTAGSTYDVIKPSTLPISSNTTAWTNCVWVYPKWRYHGDSHCIMATMGYSGWLKNYVTGSFGPAVNWNISGGVGDRGFALSNMPLYQWYHMVVQYDNGSGLVYRNGVLAGSRYDLAPAGSKLNQSTNSSYGAQPNSGDYPQWNALKLNGSIDEIRLYNRALSADEVLQLYNLGALKGYKLDNINKLGNSFKIQTYTGLR
jgi:hypothetical protein